MTTTASQPAICSQPACKVAEDGKCVENLELAKCPFYGKTIGPSVPLTGSQPATSPGAGLGLTKIEAAELLASTGGTIVALAGESNSGKTTLLTSVYESFLERSFAGYEFAGSRTLYGFEQRTYLNRTAYDLERADTLHTSSSNPELFLHLRLRVAPFDRPCENLLLADVSGETFKRATDSSDALDEIPGLRRADNFTLLLDGDLLRSVGTRQGVITSTRQILDACIDKSTIGKSTRVQLVVTKEDLWFDQPETVQFVNGKTDELISRVRSHVGSISTFLIAARRTRGDFAFGRGVDALLKAWLAPAQFVQTQAAADPGARRILTALVYGSRTNG